MIIGAFLFIGVRAGALTVLTFQFIRHLTWLLELIEDISAMIGFKLSKQEDVRQEPFTSKEGEQIIESILFAGNPNDSNQQIVVSTEGEYTVVTTQETTVKFKELG